jgi:parvulin-like peptidyl-prolyl isomerase
LTGLFGDQHSFDPERRNAVLVVALISLVVIFALALIGYGYYKDRIAPRHDIVLKVNDRNYTYAYLEERVKSDVAQGRFNLQDTGTSISNTLARIQREEIIRIMGRDRGITFSQDDMDNGLRTDLGLAADVTHDEIARFLRDELKRNKLPLDDYLDIIKSNVIEDKIKAELTSTLPAEEEQVNLLLIQGGSQANALLAKQELDAGAAFADVAKKYSQDSTSANNGGMYGWVPREALDPELADVAFSITGRSGIVETENDFYIIEVLGKETRAIDPTVIDDIGTREFNKLLETAVNDTPVGYNLTQDQILKLANTVGGTFGG